jgi:hypothetical protein
MVKTTLVEAVSPRRLRNTSYHRAPGAADRLAENQLVAPRAASSHPRCASEAPASVNRLIASAASVITSFLRSTYFSLLDFKLIYWQNTV